MDTNPRDWCPRIELGIPGESEQPSLQTIIGSQPYGVGNVYTDDVGGDPYCIIVRDRYQAVLGRLAEHFEMLLHLAHETNGPTRLGCLVRWMPSRDHMYWANFNARVEALVKVSKLY
jgi:hypothetical protein